MFSDRERGVVGEGKRERENGGTTWSKQLDTRLPSLGSRARVSVNTCGFRVFIPPFIIHLISSAPHLLPSHCSGRVCHLQSFHQWRILRYTAHTGGIPNFGGLKALRNCVSLQKKVGLLTF